MSNTAKTDDTFRVIKKFTPETCEKINYYVYRLIDPRNGNTFYVGKGKDNRVFAHAAAALQTSYEGKKYEYKNEDDESAKIKTINEIRAEGLQVQYVIHRHGMDEKTAYEVEAALIDAYPGFNEIDGHDADRGAMSALQAQKTYGAEVITTFPDKCLLIKITNPSLIRTNGDIYEAARWKWRLNKDHAKQADYVLAVKYGLVIGVYQPDKNGWYSVGERIAFNGIAAPPAVKNRYLNRRIPDKYMRQGMAMPTLFTFKPVKNGKQ